MQDEILSSKHLLPILILLLVMWIVVSFFEMAIYNHEHKDRVDLWEAMVKEVYHEAPH